MKRVRFRINYDRCIQGLQFLASRMPGITQYYAGKSFYFADRDHLIDWGRPISGDRYVAMDHGPVPSVIYDLITKASEQPDEISDALFERIEMQRQGNRILLYSKDLNPVYPALAASDREYLGASLDRHGKMSFGQLRELSHRDAAYANAWGRDDGRNNEMNPLDWISDPEETEAVYASLLKTSIVDRNYHHA